MAPANSNKRALSASVGRPPKKTKNVMSEQERMIENVVKELKGMESLPMACRLLLEASAPHSLGIPKDKRAACQARVVDMIGDALLALRREKEQALATAVENVAEEEAKKATLEAARDVMEAQVLAKVEDSSACMEKLAQAKAEIMIAKAALDASEEAQQIGNLRQKSAIDECAAVEAMLCNSFNVLKDGQFEAENEMEKHLNAVQAMASKLQFQDSLAASIPNVLIKKPDQRGTFDHVVVQELEKCFIEEVKRLQSVVAEGDISSGQRASAVEAAQATVQAAEHVAKERALALEAAQAVECELVSKRDEAAKEVQLFAPGFKQVKSLRDRLQVRLEAFEEGPYTCYEKLRDFVSTLQDSDEHMEEKAEEGLELAEAKKECGQEPASVEVPFGGA